MENELSKENQATVQLENVGVVRGGAVILDDVSFSAGQGEITAIVGPSGGGKSTLIRLVNRLEDPSSGRIRVGGDDVASIDPLELRRRVGMVLQKPFMYDGTVLHNLQQPFRYRQAPPPLAESGEMRRSLELARLDPDILGRDARTLSGGEQQRVSLARVLIGGPRVLLLDEPTSALDRPTADRLAATLHDICRSQRLTVILVTHDLRLAGRIADHLLYLEKGRVLEEGGREEFLERPRTEELRLFLAEPAEGEE
ncbi:MAG: ATP-binding cassette domain-containing protein [Geobacter sp.]|nr:ATP-binding cassette domain-containing protein [Geobacter sp.]